MKTLYIAWQDSETRLWHTVGRLKRENGIYSFVYTKGAQTSPRFSYFGRMRDVNKKYYSIELFPLFANRILNSSRPEYPTYLKWLALDSEKKTEPMQLLARSGGRRATDQLCVFPFPATNENGEMELFFLAHGLRYLDETSLSRLTRLQTGEHLYFQREPNNDFDKYALIIETKENIKIGYCPRHLNRDFIKLINETDIQLIVERLNLDAPIQFRLLCKAVFTPPPNMALFTDDEYQPLYIEKPAVA